ncbi:MAG: hypothetical protein ACLFM1_00255 [Bacteroidales bacterium]
MKYTYEILQLIAWPVLIYVSYFISMRMIDRFEKKIKTDKPTRSENQK